MRASVSLLEGEMGGKGGGCASVSPFGFWGGVGGGGAASLVAPMRSRVGAFCRGRQRLRASVSLLRKSWGPFRMGGRGQILTPPPLLPAQGLILCPPPPHVSVFPHRTNDPQPQHEFCLGSQTSSFQLPPL